MASSGPGPAGEQELIQLQVRTLSTGNHDVTVAQGGLVSELKQLLVRPTGLPVERQRVIYGGRVLEDSQTLSAAGVHDGHTLHLVEQDPAQQRQQQQQQAAAAGDGAQADPMAAFQALFGGAAVPGVDVQAVQLGPFDASNPEAWQQVAAAWQQLGSAMGGMGMPPQGGAGAGARRRQQQQGAEADAAEQDWEPLPAINIDHTTLQDVPAAQRAVWRRTVAAWQRNFVTAARSVLETAQLSGATRAAVNRVLEAAGHAPVRWVLFFFGLGLTLVLWAALRWA